MIDVCKIIERETGTRVTDDTPLEELGLDSLDLMDLLLTISKEANVDLSDDFFAKMTRVADIRWELSR